MGQVVPTQCRPQTCCESSENEGKLDFREDAKASADGMVHVNLQGGVASCPATSSSSELQETVKNDIQRKIEPSTQANVAKKEPESAPRVLAAGSRHPVSLVATSMANNSTHPVSGARPGVLNNVAFWDTSARLPLPWPRRQEAGHIFGTPTGDDLVVAVSHAWPYQVHPDPTGTKDKLINDLLDEVKASDNSLGKIYCFLDFISVTQRPRVGIENEQFSEALEAMPYVYLLADAVLEVRRKAKAWRQCRTLS